MNNDLLGPKAPNVKDPVIKPYGGLLEKTSVIVTGIPDYIITTPQPDEKEESWLTVLIKGVVMGGLVMLVIIAALTAIVMATGIDGRIVFGAALLLSLYVAFRK